MGHFDSIVIHRLGDLIRFNHLDKTLLIIKKDVINFYKDFDITQVILLAIWLSLLNNVFILGLQ